MQKHIGILQKIKRLWRNKPSLKGMRERCYEIILFIPVLWNAVTWDYSSLLSIMEHWLSRMELAHHRDKWHTNASKRAEEIKLARILIKRILSDDYHDNAFMEHDKRWGKSRWYLERWNEEDDFVRTLSKRDNVITDVDRALEAKEFKQLIDHMALLEKQDLEMLGRHLAKHLKKWWT